MGRTDAVQFTLEVADEVMRIAPRMRITWGASWESRGNGQSPNYEGGNVHHTGFGSSLANPFPARTTLEDGRPDLGGPLCNWAGPSCTFEAPWLHVVSANPANHAGASGGYNTAPLPVTTLFNPRSYGLEIDYAGLTPMTDGQRFASQVWAKAVVTVLRRGIEYIKAHAETSITGKWDPGYANGKTIDMAEFRSGAWNITGAGAAPDLSKEHEMYMVNSSAGQSLVVGDRVLNFGTPANVAGTSGIPVMSTTADMHSRIISELSRKTGLPLLVNVDNKGFFLLAGNRYTWIAENATVNQLRAIGAQTVLISQAEHDNWTKQFATP